jgi:hypothetical protein
MRGAILIEDEVLTVWERLPAARASRPDAAYQKLHSASAGAAHEAFRLGPGGVS